MTTAAERTDQLRLAGLHLRSGALRLARVELEELAGGEALDPPAILDLAEARWRTGDLRGAAAAATAWLRTTASDAAPARDQALAHAVVAESAFVRGREADVRLHLPAALVALGGPAGGLEPDGSPGVSADPGARPDPEAGAALVEALDDLFAGIPPRADAWPPFGPGTEADGARSAGLAFPWAKLAAPVPAVAEPALPWLPETVPGAGGEAPGQPGDPGSGTFEGLLVAAKATQREDPAAAATLLAIALRDPDGDANVVHSGVLDALDACATSGASQAARLPLTIVLVDALRALGRHDEAAIAYASARRLALDDVVDRGFTERGPGPGSSAGGDEAGASPADPSAASPGETAPRRPPQTPRGELP